MEDAAKVSQAFCKPCRTTTECPTCGGEPYEPVVKGGEAYVSAGFFRMGAVRRGWTCCGRCKGTGKALITSI